MILVQGRGRPRRERPSVAPSVTPSVASCVAPSVAPSIISSVVSPDSSPAHESEIFKQPEGPPEPKFPAANSVPKYSEDDLQQILKAVLEARVPVPVLAPAPALVLAPVVSEVPREKLKACSLDVYRGKSHMDYYNFCQQCENYFATVGAMGPTQIPFATSFLRDRISFRWQQYKRRHDTKTSAPVTWDKFKAFLR